MDIFSGLLLGLQTASTFSNFTYCFLGVLLGTAVGMIVALVVWLIDRRRRP